LRMSGDRATPKKVTDIGLSEGIKAKFIATRTSGVLKTRHQGKELVGPGPRNRRERVIAEGRKVPSERNILQEKKGGKSFKLQQRGREKKDPKSK